MSQQPASTDLVVLGCAQSCGKHIQSVFKNIQSLSHAFRSTQVLLLENDSTDDTIQQIRNNRQLLSNLTARSFSGLNARIPAKTERLAHLRNGAMDWLRHLQKESTTTLVMVLDFDEVNASPWPISNWLGALNWFLSQPEAAGLFANQQGPYYDLWALRHQQRCPVDVWQEVIALHLREPLLSDEELIRQAYLPWQFEITSGGAPEAVDSAFGGVGFYKLNWLQRNTSAYSGLISRWLEDPARGTKLVQWQVAEHVNFHTGLRQAGASLWIHPALINWDTSKLPQLRPNPQGWRHLSV
jgi:hypothetical protein